MGRVYSLHSLRIVSIVSSLLVGICCLSVTAVEENKPYTRSLSQWSGLFSNLNSDLDSITTSLLKYVLPGQFTSNLFQPRSQYGQRIVAQRYRSNSPYRNQEPGYDTASYSFPDVQQGSQYTPLSEGQSAVELGISSASVQSNTTDAYNSAKKGDQDKEKKNAAASTTAKSELVHNQLTDAAYKLANYTSQLTGMSQEQLLSAFCNAFTLGRLGVNAASLYGISVDPASMITPILVQTLTTDLNISSIQSQTAQDAITNLATAVANNIVQQFSAVGEKAIEQMCKGYGPKDQTLGGYITSIFGSGQLTNQLDYLNQLIPSDSVAYATISSTLSALSSALLAPGPGGSPPALTYLAQDLNLLPVNHVASPPPANTYSSAPSSWPFPLYNLLNQYTGYNLPSLGTPNYQLGQGLDYISNYVSGAKPDENAVNIKTAGTSVESVIPTLEALDSLQSLSNGAPLSRQTIDSLSYLLGGTPSNAFATILQTAFASPPYNPSQDYNG